MNPDAESYFAKAGKWPAEMRILRAILLDCELEESLKWGSPCYSLDQKNIAIIGELNNCCVLSFFKGALLKDEEGILTKPGKNTQAARTVQFRTIGEIQEKEAVLKSYIREAIEIEKAGLAVDFKEKRELTLTKELLDKMEANPALKKAFNALTPGRQRAYVLHFSAAKQAKTRESRVEKLIPRILSGKGLNDD